MRYFFTLLITLLFNSLLAQNPLISFSEESMLIDGVATNVGTIVLDAELEAISDGWDDFSKDELDLRMKERKHIFTAEKIVINQVTDKRGDLQVQVYKVDKQVKVTAFYRLGYDVYLNSTQNPEEFGAFKQLLIRFGYQFYADYLPEKIKEEKKGIKGLKKNIKKADKTIKKSNKTIKKANKSLKKDQSKLSDIADKSPENEEDAKTIKKEIASLESNIKSANIDIVEAEAASKTATKQKETDAKLLKKKIERLAELESKLLTVQGQLKLMKQP